MRAQNVTPAAIDPVTIEIGGTAISLQTHNPQFCRLLLDRYAGFVADSRPPRLRLDVELTDAAHSADPDQDLQVAVQGRDWFMQRGDFHARWNPATGRGFVHQPASPYAIDSVLRIIHSLILVGRGGFLLHAASAIRRGHAFLFAGVSGAGKTTISRLAPPDASLLTDEISYVIRKNGKYFACGTPFSGELGRSGENVSAPIKTMFLLNQGPENRIETVSEIDKIRSLLRNILFFAADPQLVNRVFDSACEFVSKVPVCRLTFFPDERVWNIIV
ncbi:MAG TPA: hypothetical protein VEH30_05230 [Terriglobales bacterium]|nr:hypothetical protein [Terriglobales bacterium]